MKETPYWWDTVAFPAGEQEPPAGAVDVAVIGAGITGLSAALELARRGLRVAVLETHTLGWGASSRNGGQVLTGLHAAPEHLIKHYGLDLARRMFAASLDAIADVERLTHAEAIDCDFARTGHLEVAARAGHFPGFIESAATLEREFKHRLHLLGKEQVAAELGTDAYFGGILDEHSATVNPARFTAGLAEAARRRGARLFDNAAVDRLAREGERWRVITRRGALLADHVFVATSGYTGPVTPALQRRLVPFGSYIIATEPLGPDVLERLLPHRRAVFDSNKFLHYFRLSADGRLLFGGRAGFFPETPQTVNESAAILQRDLARVFPQTAGVEVTHVWGGTLDFAFDEMPHAGALGGLHFALGYAGHGVALATYLGLRMAAALAGETVENPFTEIPFPTAPLGLYDGKPWFLPALSVYFQMLDRLS
ncbi:MAG: FAD-binding oxidoreductase [Anaerolineales bacterium]|nr:FAD-binding oxidoreductase [Anaerolineales bacterium]